MPSASSHSSEQKGCCALDFFANCEQDKATSRFAKYSNLVHVISKSAWHPAVAADPTLEAPLAEWYKIAKNAGWKSIVDVRKTYPHADFVDPYTVFNIKGDKYRLIVKIEYRWQMIFVKHVLSHAEYDKGAWKK